MSDGWSTYFGASTSEPHGSETADGGWTPPQPVRSSRPLRDASQKRLVPYASLRGCSLGRTPNTFANAASARDVRMKYE